MTNIGPNFIARPYRGVSVQSSPVPLDAMSLREYLVGRAVYRRTCFIVLARGGDRAVVHVEKATTEPLFTPVTKVRYLAGPSDVAFLADSAVDTGNASQMARAALASGVKARIYVIEGRFQHVNFIVDPSPVVVRVVEVVPPEPPKLLEMARQVLDYDEDLPPIELRLARIDLRKLAADAGADRYLFPCRCAGLDLDVPVDFLDACPPVPHDWTMVGCERSRQIHEALYGRDPARRVEMCPRILDAGVDGPALVKCCLLERGIDSEGTRQIVPWGANLEEVRRALHRLVG